MIILMTLAATEATKLVTSFTRFSEEIFTSVVAIFFVSEAVYYLIQVSTTIYPMQVILHKQLVYIDLSTQSFKSQLFN